MTSETQSLVPVDRQEIEPGKPLPWAVYDAERNLLLGAGVVVGSESQLRVLIENGLFRESAKRAHTAVPPRPKGEKAVEPVGKTVTTEEFPDVLKLMPGDSLQLQPLIEGQTDRYTVRVIGMMKARSVLVTAPTVDGKLIFVREAQPFLIRAFSGQNVYAFKSKVLKAQHSPFAYLHLSYPESLQVMRIRKAMRAPARIIAAIYDKEGGRGLGAGRIVDISVGGARLHIGRDVQVQGDDVFIAFKVVLEDIEEYISTRVTIRRLADEDDDEGRPVRVMGVEFDALPQQQRLALMNVVYQHLLKEAL